MRKAYVEHVPPVLVVDAELNRDASKEQTMHETSFYLTGRMAAEEAALLGSNGRKSTPLSFINTTINSETPGRNEMEEIDLEGIAHCVSSPVLDN